jgi:hypothetical protein
MILGDEHLISEVVRSHPADPIGGRNVNIVRSSTTEDSDATKEDVPSAISSTMLWT